MITDKRQSAGRAILRRLAKAYPDARCALDYRDEFQLLVAVILSAQCTDAKVNSVLPKLFTRFPDAPALAAARVSEVESLIRSLGLYRAKAANIVATAAAWTRGVGWTMDELTRLPGVGRKTANVVLCEARGIHEGIAVDTHCGRVARRLGLTRHDDPVRVERDLMLLFPRRRWGQVTHLFIAHGRALCRARSPLCSRCLLHKSCPAASVA